MEGGDEVRRADVVAVACVLCEEDEVDDQVHLLHGFMRRKVTRILPA